MVFIDMKSEEIIMLVFVGFIVVVIPLLLWKINKDENEGR
jgi:hypothetical protein